MKLIVVSEKFGLNFSGGCISTVQFLQYLRHSFSEIMVLTQEVGTHHLKKVQFILYSNAQELHKILKQEKTPQTIGYGDFYIAEAFINASIPFFFTYHDNWPEMAQHAVFDEAFGMKRIECYQRIFNQAQHIFSVSKAKLPFIKQQTQQVSLIRNGVFQKVEKRQVLYPLKKDKVKILMAGNIETRKYQKAVELFSLLNGYKHELEIDIYGLPIDEQLAETISTFDFAHIKGYAPTINFKPYHLYLNTSLIENLSIAVVDSIANYTPVITFDVGGLKEVINDRNGYAILPYNVEAMKNKLLHFDFDTFYANFDTSTIDNFSWERGAKKMAEIMQKPTSFQ